MQIAARIGTWSGKKLPYLRRVAYLESHGEEWIDTGIVFSSGKTFEVDGCWTAEAATISFSSMTSSDGDSGGIIRYVNGGFMTIHPGVKWVIVSMKNFERHRIECGKNGVYLDGNLVYEGLIFGTSKYTLMLARWSRVDFDRMGYCKYYGFKFFDFDDSTMMDLVPVIDFDGRPCMYNQAPLAISADDMSRFFYNQGTGEFTWGELDAASNAPSQLGGGITADA